ncbi:MAG: ABC transporter substrate-binding protein [Acetobacteraceae bacterium]
MTPQGKQTIIPNPTRRSVLTLPLILAAGRAHAGSDTKYGPGVSDTEIKIGQTMPYSGPASSFGATGKAAAAYYRMVNDQGGVNGRKVNLLSLDDEFSPPKSVEAVRRLVEDDQVLGIFGSLGTPGNAAAQRYLNDHRIPQFFIFSGVARFRDPKRNPWSIAGDLAFASSAKAFAGHVLRTNPEGKIGVLFQNDDFGKDHLAGLRLGLGEKNAAMVAGTVSYEVTDPTVDAQIITLKESGADVVMLATIPKFAALSIRKIHEIGWKPQILLAYPGATIEGALKPAGLDASTGIVTVEYIKQPGDPVWAGDPEMQAYLATMKKYAPDQNPNDRTSVSGYHGAAMVVSLLKQCGDDLTRENLLRQATHMRDVRVPMLLPDVLVNTTPDNYMAINQMRLQRFDGSGWVVFGDVVTG